MENNKKEDSIFKGLGVEINFENDQDFLKIVETLTRIGVASKKTNTLWQSCHILHKQGRYAIFHFKELFILDGKPSDFSEEDKRRRNTIADLLADWGLVDIKYPDEVVDQVDYKPHCGKMTGIKVLSFKEKGEWSLQSKYNIGKKKG